MLASFSLDPFNVAVLGPPISPPFGETRITSMACQNRTGYAGPIPSIISTATGVETPTRRRLYMGCQLSGGFFFPPTMLPKSWTWMCRPHMLPLTGSAPNQALFAFRPLSAPQFSPLLHLANRSPRVPHLNLTVRPPLPRSTASLKNKIDRARAEREIYLVF